MGYPMFIPEKSHVYTGDMQPVPPVSDSDPTALPTAPSASAPRRKRALPRHCRPSATLTRPHRPVYGSLVYGSQEAYWPIRHHRQSYSVLLHS